MYTLLICQGEIVTHHTLLTKCFVHYQHTEVGFQAMWIFSMQNYADRTNLTTSNAFAYIKLL